MVAGECRSMMMGVVMTMNLILNEFQKRKKEPVLFDDQPNEKEHE